MLAYDILFGKGIRCGGRLGAFAREKSSRLFEILEDFQSNGPRNIENTSISKCVLVSQFCALHLLKYSFCFDNIFI